MLLASRSLLLYLAGLLPTAAFEAQRVPSVRSTSISRVQRSICLEYPPAGVVVTVLSGAAIFLRPESALWSILRDADPDARADELSRVLCRNEGWGFRLSIGADVARSLGGTGLTASSSAESTAEIALELAFERNTEFGAYPQGTVRLLRDSRFVSDELGLWSIESDGSSESLVQALEVRLQSEGIALSGVELVRPGPFYLSALLDIDERAARVTALTAGSVQPEETISAQPGDSARTAFLLLPRRFTPCLIVQVLLTPASR